MGSKAGVASSSAQCGDILDQIVDLRSRQTQIRHRGMRMREEGPQLIGGQGHEALSGQLGEPYLQYGIDIFSRKHAGQKTSPQPEQRMPVLSGSNLCPQSGQHHSPDCFVNCFVKGILSNIINSTSRVPNVDCQVERAEPSTLHEAHRWASTGILECVSTLTVSLPRTIAAMPWRPCEAMTIRSQPFDAAVSIIAW